MDKRTFLKINAALAGSAIAGKIGIIDASTIPKQWVGKHYGYARVVPMYEIGIDAYLIRLDVIYEDGEKRSVVFIRNMRTIDEDIAMVKGLITNKQKRFYAAPYSDKLETCYLIKV